MTLGILAHAARFFVFAIGDPLWLMVAINVVHGMCYAFFFAAVYIYVDERCPRDARASAQGLFNLVILGVDRSPAVCCGDGSAMCSEPPMARLISRGFSSHPRPRARGCVADGCRVSPEGDARDLADPQISRITQMRTTRIGLRPIAGPRERDDEPGAIMRAHHPALLTRRSRRRSRRCGSLQSGERVASLIRVIRVIRGRIYHR